MTSSGLRSFACSDGWSVFLRTWVLNELDGMGLLLQLQQ